MSTSALFVLVAVAALIVGLLLGYSLAWGRAHRKAWSAIEMSRIALTSRHDTDRATAVFIAAMAVDFMHRMKP